MIIFYIKLLVFILWMDFHQMSHMIFLKGWYIMYLMCLYIMSARPVLKVNTSLWKSSIALLKGVTVNKPQSMSNILSTFSVKQTAAQPWCLLRLFPFIVGSFVP